MAERVPDSGLSDPVLGLEAPAFGDDHEQLRSLAQLLCDMSQMRDQTVVEQVDGDGEQYEVGTAQRLLGKLVMKI